MRISQWLSRVLKQSDSWNFIMRLIHSLILTERKFDKYQMLDVLLLRRKFSALHINILFYKKSYHTFKYFIENHMHTFKFF